MSTALLDFGVDYCNIPPLVEKYSAVVEQAANKIKVKGKTLKQANEEQSDWLFFYEQHRVELSILTKMMESEVEKVRASLYRTYSEGYSKQLTDRVIEKYIDGEEQYQVPARLLLVFKELQDKTAAIVEAFRSRGFSLKNIVELQVNNIQDLVI